MAGPLNNAGALCDATRVSSAEQPARQVKVEMPSIRHLRQWLDEDPTSNGKREELQRIREAPTVMAQLKHRHEGTQSLRPQMQTPQLYMEPSPKTTAHGGDALIRRFEKAARTSHALPCNSGTSAEQPATRTIEQTPTTDTTEKANLHDAEMRTRLRDKRAKDSGDENPRPLARARRSQHCSKHRAAQALDSAATALPKHKHKSIKLRLLERGARNLADQVAKHNDTAPQTSSIQKQRRLMQRLFHELGELATRAWVVGENDERCKALACNALNMQTIPALKGQLKSREMTSLYKDICGYLHTSDGRYQDYTHVTLTASFALERQAMKVVQPIHEISETNMHLYPCLWELKTRDGNQSLNALPEMPRSTHELMERLKEPASSTTIPFGRIPFKRLDEMPFLECPEYFVRMLALLELPCAIFAELPIPQHHTELINKIVEHRSITAQASAVQPASNGTDDVKESLKAFFADPYSDYAKKRWLWNVLKVSKKRRRKAECVAQLCDKAADDFFKAKDSMGSMSLPHSQHTLAVLALYHQILVTWKKTAPEQEATWRMPSHATR